MIIANPSPSLPSFTRDRARRRADDRPANEGLAAEEPFPERGSSGSAADTSRDGARCASRVALLVEVRVRNTLREAPAPLAEPLPPSKPVRSPRASRTALRRSRLDTSATGSPGMTGAPRILIGRRSTRAPFHRHRARVRFARADH
jgi:hypothetical protein